MKQSTLVLILLLVLTSGLLINRQSLVHSLQTTINNLQTTIKNTPTQTVVHNPDDLKQISTWRQSSQRFEGMWKFEKLGHDDSEYTKEIGELREKLKRSTDTCNYIESVYKDLQQSEKALLDDWHKALPQLKQFHQEHPEQPLPFDVNDGRY